MMTDEEAWGQALTEVENDLGPYPQRDVGKSVIIAISIFIASVLVHSITVQGSTILAAVLIAVSVGGGHFSMWEIKRWGYKQRLRTNFWSIQIQEEIAAKASDDGSNRAPSP